MVSNSFIKTSANVCMNSSSEKQPSRELQYVSIDKKLIENSQAKV